MVEFDIKGCSRKCAKTDQEIGRGQFYFSVLLHDDDDQLIRLDYSEEVWEGPPEECLGWWKSQVPNLEDGKVYWAPNDVLFAYFDEILASGKNPEKLYLMALLMVRRRLMKLDDVQASNQSRIRLSSNRHDSVIEIPVVALAAQQVEQLQNDLGAHLFTNRVVGEDSND